MRVQVLLCESALSGALILAGMALSSRIAAVAAYAGALGGSALALALGVDSAAIGHGLWGYNSCLTATAVLTFFAPSVASGAVGAIGVGLTVLLDGALRSAAAPLGVPVGTLPFCFASLTLMLTQGGVPGMHAVPLAEVSTAEEHLYAARVSHVTEIGPVATARGGDEHDRKDVEAGIGATAARDATPRDMPYPITSAGEGSRGGSVGRLPASTAARAGRRGSGGLGTDVSPVGRREALVLSPRCTPLDSPAVSRDASLHGAHGALFWRRGPPASGLTAAATMAVAAVPGGGARATVGGRQSPAPMRNRTLHGGSHHGEAYVARELAAMVNGSGHGRRVAALALRAADAMGLSPPAILSPEPSLVGGDAFASLLEHEEGSAEGSDEKDAAEGALRVAPRNARPTPLLREDVGLVAKELARV